MKLIVLQKKQEKLLNDTKLVNFESGAILTDKINSYVKDSKMKNWTKNLRKTIAVALSVVTLAMTLFANVPLFQCSASGLVGLKKLDLCGASKSETTSCSCCTKTAESTDEAQLSIRASACCHYISLKTQQSLTIQNDFNLIDLELAIVHSFTPTQVEKITQLYPRRSNQTPPGLSPPLYILEQSLLI